MWAFLWEGEEAGFWRVTGQQAQRDPDGLSQSRAGIDKGGFPIHHTSGAVVRVLKGVWERE